MESSSPTFPVSATTNDSARNHTKYKKIISTLPQTKSWIHSKQLCHYQGFWCYPTFLEGIMSVQEHFAAQPTDVMICSSQKSGTTWLKSLCFAILTRSQYFSSDLSTSHPLLTKFAHGLVPTIELDSSWQLNDGISDFGVSLWATHIPYNSLPKPIIESNSKIVYIFRDPKDVFISFWHFKISSEGTSTTRDLVPLEEAFEKFCEGVSNYGPYWDHVLGYWKASLEFPEKILFIKYEDLKNDCLSYVKRLAEFMGCPFSADEEERDGLVQKIVDLCSFDSLSNLEVNKSERRRSFGGPTGFEVKNKAFFRKGKIGDWENYLTPEMAAQINKITEDKFSGSGLTL